jgi:DNA-binding NarL/FixJ family response regulator
MLAICEGKTSREIAAAFGRSFHTIRNQMLKVYAAMHIRTRTARHWSPSVPSSA